MVNISWLLSCKHGEVFFQVLGRGEGILANVPPADRCDVDLPIVESMEDSIEKPGLAANFHALAQETDSSEEK